MWMQLLAHVSMYGIATMLVLAMTAIAFAWLGGLRGVLLGQVYLALSVFHLDINLIVSPIDTRFLIICLIHFVLVNLLLAPAWVLGVLLRHLPERSQRQPSA